MWTPEHRQAAARRGLRYPSDLTDAEWALIEPMIPPARRSAARRERPRGAQRDLLCSLDGLPVVGAAQGPAAEVDGTSLLHAVGLGRHA